MRTFSGFKPEFGKPRFHRPVPQQKSVPDQVNVVFVYGAGNDDRYGEAMRWLQDQIKDYFGDKIYSPRIIDHREVDALVEALLAWSDPTILVGHSCGGETVTQAPNRVSTEAIPYVMVIAPSVFCDPDPVGANVARITQASSNEGDLFNPRQRMLVSANPGNTVTLVDEIQTNADHLDSPRSPAVRDRLIEEIERALGGVVEQPPDTETPPEPPAVKPTVVVTADPEQVTILIEQAVG